MKNVFLKTGDVTEYLIAQIKLMKITVQVRSMIQKILHCRNKMKNKKYYAVFVVHFVPTCIIFVFHFVQTVWYFLFFILFRQSNIFCFSFCSDSMVFFCVSFCSNSIVFFVFHFVTK
jgi:hypothetical protein